MAFPIIKSIKWIKANLVSIVLKDGRVFMRALPEHVGGVRMARAVVEGLVKEGDHLRILPLS